MVEIPVDVFYVSVTCVVKGKPFKQIYLVDPRVGPQVDSLSVEEGNAGRVGEEGVEGEDDASSFNPFWSTFKTVEGECKLVPDSITTSSGTTAKVKQVGYKGLKPPMQIEIIFPILTNEHLLGTGTVLRGPPSLLHRLPAAKLAVIAD